VRFKLLKIFGLKRTATDAEILAAATRCAAIAAERATMEEEREVIDAMRRDAHGGLTERQCRQIINRRGGFAAHTAIRKQRP
jgi:hypothetical protein